ncbi:MAG TPA: GTP cyclohydrolase, FolE2/MptA family [Pyrinomonadaceae bacterium]|jgi:GTP cyclohydrolase I
MKGENEQIIHELISRGGGWATKALFDDAASRIINGEKQNFALAETVFKQSSGRGAIKNFNRYNKLTGFELDSQKISSDLSGRVAEVLPLEEVERFCPAGEASNYWLEKLCEHLGASRKQLSERINSFRASEAAPPPDSFELLKNYGARLIGDLFDFQADGVRLGVVESERAELCWRRWHLSKKDAAPVLFESHRFSGLGRNQFFVWRLIHDTAHLIHLAKFPRAGNPLVPEWLATMEAAAMFAERTVFERLEQGALEVPTEFDAEKIKTVLLLGFAERALRLDYDLSVHLHQEPVLFWIQKTLRQTGLPESLFKFAEEFHGLPGLCSAYQLGAESFAVCEDKHVILSGSEALDFFAARRGDDLSRAEETDIPARQPTHAVKINRVGTTGAMLRTNVLNPLNAIVETMNFEVELTVDLTAERRGIHMSRLQQIVLAAGDRSWNGIAELADFLAQEARRLQQSENAIARLKTKLLQPSYNVLSQTNSAQPLAINFRHEQSGDVAKRTIEVSAGIMTACPCTLAYSRLKGEKTISRQMKSPHFVLPEDFPPTFTHSQPGELSVAVTSTGSLPDLPDLIRCLDAEAHLVESVLKRPDEHRLVEKTHRRPQFGEDVCRSVAVTIASILAAGDLLTVSVSLNESIHPHRVYAEISTEASELWC